MIPSGRFHGIVHGRMGLLNRIWTGKVFTGYKVKNLILGREHIEGNVSNEHGIVVISYPQLGLTDRLVPANADGSVWHGTMALFGQTVRFTLTRAE